VRWSYPLASRNRDLWSPPRLRRARRAGGARPRCSSSCASQINGCSFCCELHGRELRDAGCSDERIATVAAWREAPSLSIHAYTLGSDEEQASRVGPIELPQLAHCDSGEVRQCAVALSGGPRPQRRWRSSLHFVFRIRWRGSTRHRGCRRTSRPAGGTRAAASCVAGSSPQRAGSARRRRVGDVVEHPELVVVAERRWPPSGALVPQPDGHGSRRSVCTRLTMWLAAGPHKSVVRPAISRTDQWMPDSQRWSGS
jgi:AhpD family alkylhydroperoxidase